jgi:hypothetical protein
MFTHRPAIAEHRGRRLFYADNAAFGTVSSLSRWAGQGRRMTVPRSG